MPSCREEDAASAVLPHGDVAQPGRGSLTPSSRTSGSSSAAKPVSVCIDSLNRSLAGSENDDEAMGAYVRAADAIRAAFGCLVVIVHHGPRGDRPRGHSSSWARSTFKSLSGAMRTTTSLANSSYRKTARPARNSSLVSRSSRLASDQDGDPISSCVIEAVDEAAAAPKVTAKGRTSDVEKIERAIADAYDRLADGVAPSPGFDGALVRKVQVDKLRDEIKSRGFLETDDDDKLTSTARSNFRRAKTDLIAEKRFIEADKQLVRLSKSPPEPPEGQPSF